MSERERIYTGCSHCHKGLIIVVQECVSEVNIYPEKARKKEAEKDV